MAILKVANVHLNSTGTSRIEYRDDDVSVQMRTEHKERIENLLKSEKRECEKSRISLQVLQAQLDALPKEN